MVSCPGQVDVTVSSITIRLVSPAGPAEEGVDTPSPPGRTISVEAGATDYIPVDLSAYKKDVNVAVALTFAERDGARRTWPGHGSGVYRHRAPLVTDLADTVLSVDGDGEMTLRLAAIASAAFPYRLRRIVTGKKRVSRVVLARRAQDLGHVGQRAVLPPGSGCGRRLTALWIAIAYPASASFRPCGDDRSRCDLATPSAGPPPPARG